MCSGNKQALTWLRNLLGQSFDIKAKIIGREGEQEGTYLNRLIRWTQGGFEVEGDPKHVEVLMREWGMQECKGVDTPIWKDDLEDRSQRAPMKNPDATLFRRAVARINYISQDRPDIGVASRKVSRCMADPRVGDEVFVKRILRYLRNHSRCINVMRWQPVVDKISIFIDSDWAGDQATRCSTSGGLLLRRNHLIGHWCKMQGRVALSSGEAELNAAVRGLSEGIGVVELMGELGMNVKINLLTDASVCRSTLLRKGRGKVKHLTTKQLWSQGAIESYGVEVTKIPRAANPADVLTHGCAAHELFRHMRMVSQRV